MKKCPICGAVMFKSKLKDFYWCSDTYHCEYDEDLTKKDDEDE